jgi:hypothetical protein
MENTKYQKTYNIKVSSMFVQGFLLYLFSMVIFEMLLSVFHLEKTSIPVYFRIGIYILGIIAHELIHGVFAAIYSPNGFKNIKFGIKWKFIAAYCQCMDADMKIKHFKIVVIMPFIILGIIPFIWGISMMHEFVMKFGIILSVGSIGDLIMFNWLCKEKNNYWVKEGDNTKKLEIVVFEK